MVSTQKDESYVASPLPLAASSSGTREYRTGLKIVRCKRQCPDTATTSEDGARKFDGKFRPVNENETINEVVSNWGAAQAMLQKQAEAQKPIVRFRPSNDNETINEVISNWGAAQAMMRKQAEVEKAADKFKNQMVSSQLFNGTKSSWKFRNHSAKLKMSSEGPSATALETQRKFRPPNDNETINEVISNWGAAQAMVQKQENLQKFGGNLKAPGDAPAIPAVGAQGRFRPPNDNETINEVISNWGAAQGMVQKQVDTERSVEIRTPAEPQRIPNVIGTPQKLRPQDDNETINEVLSNWGAAQGVVQKQAVPQKPLGKKLALMHSDSF
ncbi:hypothetical protein DICVIV_08501 [Dictyocaulus viviparus]|uniref:Uncharacterized protein n=1 Tax=Dictyocaulus viviparus TaxID=29172 RepID=A0A0D8XNY7_DICVI|nr:hypothetical protein DICVIV_08501 [Dictyocaulus viviparus]